MHHFLLKFEIMPILHGQSDLNRFAQTFKELSAFLYFDFCFWVNTSIGCKHYHHRFNTEGAIHSIREVQVWYALNSSQTCDLRMLATDNGRSDRVRSWRWAVGKRCPITAGIPFVLSKTLFL